ncbi:MAG TPA: glycosyltransferase family 39 protein, partial [Solirubrobacteraceae bacterium]|nr:glycosyltransferase family 39 protein [Solirubrobacteraceae bacterium]
MRERAASAPALSVLISERSRRTASSPSVWVGVLGCAVIALVLRVVFVGDQSLGYEEVFTRTVVAAPNLSGLWHALERTESTPPLYYVLTWLWVKIGGSDGAAALRAISVIAGVATVPVVFAAVRSFLGSREALVVAWLAAISPVLVGYSIYARSYALLVLAGALSVWALTSVLDEPSRGRWALWALTSVVAVWTHYFAGFLIVAEVAFLLFALPGSRRSLLLASVAVAAAVAPLWQLFHAQNSAAERTAYIAARPLGSRLGDVVRQFSMGTNVPATWLEAAGIALFGAATLYGAARAARDPDTRVFAVVAAIAAALPVLSALTGIDDHLLARNLLAEWICVAALAAYPLTMARRLPLLAYSVICVATVLLVQTNWHYRAATDWQGAAARLRGPASGQPVAVIPGVQEPVAALYLRRAPLAAPASSADLWVAVEPARGAG